MTLPSVHFYRPYYGPTHKKGPTVGKDVIALKIIMERAGYFRINPGGPDGTYNKAFQNAVKELQRDYHITPVSGNTGPKTFVAMRGLKHHKYPKEYAFGRAAVVLYNNAKAEYLKPKVADVREFISDALFDTYSARGAIDYTQTRPIYPVVNRIVYPRKIRKADCSGLAIYATWLANQHFAHFGIRVPAYDPKYGNTGYGNTYSLITGGKRVNNTGDTKVGDLVFYPGHVAIVVSLSKGIHVVSHGSQSGPLYLSYNYRPVSQIRTYDLYEVI